MGRKKKKKPQEGETKTMKELTKGFDEFMKNRRTRRITKKKESDTAKEDFEELLKKTVKPQK